MGLKLTKQPIEQQCEGVSFSCGNSSVQKRTTNAVKIIYCSPLLLTARVNICAGKVFTLYVNVLSLSIYKKDLCKKESIEGKLDRI